MFRLGMVLAVVAALFISTQAMAVPAEFKKELNEINKVIRTAKSNVYYKKKYDGMAEELDRAEQLATKSIATFFPDDSPLPKASSLHDHYEAITRADTLVMALLNLWAAKTKPDMHLGLTWSER